MLVGPFVAVSRRPPGAVGAITSGNVVAVSGALGADSFSDGSTATTRTARVQLGTRPVIVFCVLVPS